jgi:hypothetical protein
MKSLSDEFALVDRIPPAGSPAPILDGIETRKGGRPSLSSLTAAERCARRSQQLREAKQRQRAKQSSLGDRTITITLTAGEAIRLAEMRTRQRGPVEGFERRALLLGAVFLANAGNKRGNKVKGNSAAAAIAPAIDDKSTNAQEGVE